MLPRKALIGPFTYRISEKPADWKRYAPDEDPDFHWGFTAQGPAVILIQAGINPALQRTVLLHELLHACCFVGGLLDTRKRPEEEFVVAVAPTLLDAVTRSPGMAAFLFGGRA